MRSQSTERLLQEDHRWGQGTVRRTTMAGKDGMRCLQACCVCAIFEERRAHSTIKVFSPSPFLYSPGPISLSLAPSFVVFSFGGPLLALVCVCERETRLRLRLRCCSFLLFVLEVEKVDVCSVFPPPGSARCIQEGKKDFSYAHRHEEEAR